MRFPSLTTVIAYIRTMMVGATPIQLVGHAHQEPTQPIGKVSTALATKLRKSPARQPSQKKPKAVQSTKVASKSTSKKSKPAQMARSRKAAGSSTPTPARKTRQHAK